MNRTRPAIVAVASLGVAVPLQSAMASSPGHRPAPSATHPSVPRLAQQWAHAWNTGSARRMASLFTKDGVYVDHGFQVTYRGPAGAGRWVDDTMDNFTTLRATTKRAFRDGDDIGVVWTFSGTFNGTGAFPEAAGKSFSVPATSVFRTKHGKIASVEDFHNPADLMAQVGMAR
ncbi:nuclear transport factor 2 family protein [Streptomyces sp. NPDC026672]|uniref:nuclear transport factor 2 family protein n=1 Tax=unclassified Streptomyces TaxID=2593676 RepID=UPI0033CC2760